jgi:hypothetical protein
MLSLRPVVLLLLSFLIAVAGCSSSQAGQQQPTPVVALVPEVPQPCPTPLYPSQAQPPAIPIYPNAQQVQVQTFGKVEMDGSDQFHAPAWIRRRTTFTTPDTAQAVRVFYKDVVEQAHWRPDDPKPPTDEFYYFWSVNIKAWEDPPCNATPETGLPVFLLKLLTNEVGAGETQVEVLEGVMLGF